MIRKSILVSLFLFGLLFGLSYESRTSADNAVPAKKPVLNSNQWALLIGVGDYPGSTVDLKYPGADARSIKELLVSSAGYAEDHIRLLTDDGAGENLATKQNIYAAIDQYLAPRVQSGHEIIIFMAGHGIVDGVGAQAKSYFLPVDTDIQNKETVARTAVDMEELTRKVSALKASQFTIFYDACREDPSPGRGFKGNPLTDVTARILTLGPTRGGQSQSRTDPATSVVFYACQIGERAFESAQLQHGVFTYYILRGLRELAGRPDGRVEAGQLAGYLSENVRKWSQEARNPFGQNQNPTMVASEVRGPITVARVLPLSPNVPETSAVSGLMLSTFPEGATISINGKQAGRGPIQKDLSPSQYTVRAEMPGFQASETKINVVPGYRQELIINLQPSAGNSNYEKGVQFERQQLWPQAISAYQQALREDPKSAAVYGSLAQIYVKSGQYSEAVALLTEAVRLFPDNALILARRSRANSAIKLGEDFLAASSPAPGPGSQSGAQRPEEESGKKSKKSKKNEEAQNGGNQVASAPQSDQEPAEESGKKSKKSKKSKASGKGKKKDEVAFAPPAGSQSFAPQSNEEPVEEAGKKSKKSKSGKAGKKSDEESSEAPQNSEIQSRSLAGVLNNGGAETRTTVATGSGDALRDAELAIQKDAGLAESHLALGFALLAEGKDYDRALSAFVLASTIAPEDAEAYYGVGYAYRLKQQCNLAVPQLKRAIELRPDYYEAHRELAYSYHIAGATDLAIREYVVATSYRAATKESSEYAANNIALGSLYRKKGKEIGGAQIDLYNLTGKACEDDARKEESDLKRAVSKLGSAGVLKLVEEHAPPEIRKLMEGYNGGPLNGGIPAKGAGAAPCNCGQPAPVNNLVSPAPVIVVPEPAKPPKGGKNKKKKEETEQESYNPPINVGPSVIIPIPVGPGPRPPRRDPRVPDRGGRDEEPKEPKEPKEPRDPNNDGRDEEPKEPREPKEPKGPREPKGPKEPKEPKEPKGPREPKGPKGSDLGGRDKEPKRPKTGGIFDVPKYDGKYRPRREDPQIYKRQQGGKSQGGFSGSYLSKRPIIINRDSRIQAGRSSGPVRIMRPNTPMMRRSPSPSPIR